jgi:succinoglycan biosynthesis protein ExoO
VKISVIIPAHNAESTICRAIDSALNQNGVEIEVIVVNDCSQDSTESLINHRYSQHEQVKLFGTQINSGPSIARNMGIGNACGSWVALLDADDWMKPCRLSTLLFSALEHELDFIADSYYLIRDQYASPHSTRFSLLSEPGSVTQFTASSFVRHGLGSVKPLIKKAFLARSGIRFEPSVWCGEDLLFFVTLLLNNARFGLLNRPLYCRSETADSLTKSDKIKLLSDLLGVFTELQDLAMNIDNESTEFTDALIYRTSVVKDSLASARWESWLKNPANKRLPSFAGLLNAVRHQLLRNKRYHITKITDFHDQND